MLYYPYKYIEPLNGSEYAKQNRTIGGKPFSFSISPFFEEITKAACDNVNYSEVIVCSPAQLGKTTLIENVLCYYTNMSPANSLLICDTLKTSQNMAKTRIRTFLKQATEIEKMAKSEKSTSVTNFTLAPNAYLTVGSSSSASDLCSNPIKYLFCDELDRWTDEIKNEGDPLVLARARQLTFRGMAILTSTPTTNDGRILTEYRTGTQEIWVARCNCGYGLKCEYSEIIFGEGEPYVVCPKCGEVYTERQVKQLKHEFDKPLNTKVQKDKFGRIKRSFRIYGGLCHNQFTWSFLRQGIIENKTKSDCSLQSWYNTKLGEVYIPPSVLNFDIDVLSRYAESYDLNKFRFKYKVAGVDTHDNGFYISVYGITDDESFVGIKFYYINGKLSTSQIPWNELEKVASEVDLMCVDSGGHYTQDIYAFCALHSKKILPIKGLSVASNKAPFISKLTKVNFNTIARGTGATYLLMLGVNAIKDKISEYLIDYYTRSNNNKLHFDRLRGFNESFFTMLTSEKPHETKFGNMWEKLPGVHNEALDTLVYAFAALQFLKNKNCDIGALKSIIKGK